MSKEKSLEEYLNEPKKPLFTPQELEQFKMMGIELTPEDIAVFEEANIICDTVDLLPENEDKVFSAIEKKIPDTDDLNVGMEAFANLIEKKDPIITETAALYELLNYLVEEIPPEIVKLDTATAIQQERDKELMAEIEGILATV